MSEHTLESIVNALIAAKNAQVTDVDFKALATRLIRASGVVVE
jgi:hypothetical protein